MGSQGVIKFTKMHGIGNDYVYIDCFKQKLDTDIPLLAQKISDRHFGVGSDGLVLIMPSDKADFMMRIFNSDGSEAEMCGNATRCVGKYVFERGLTSKTTITLETLAGIKILELTVEDNKVKSVRVDMGEPILTAEKIPVKSSKDGVIKENVRVGEKEYTLTCVSMGNPHAVTFVDDVNSIEIEKIGPKIENHEIFPRRTNVEFVHVINRSLIDFRVWERGAGETLACGTGSCGAVVAAVLNDLIERNATVKLRGGELNIEWSEQDNHVYMTGPATFVFDGEYYL